MIPEPLEQSKQVSPKPRANTKRSRRANGTGSISEVKKTGRWRWEVILGYVKGKPIRKFGTSPNRTEAQKAAAQAVTDHARGLLAAPDKITVKELLEQWLESRKSRISENTATRNEGVIRKHIVPFLGDIRVQALKPTDLRAFYKHLATTESRPKKNTEPIKKHGKKQPQSEIEKKPLVYLSPKSIRHIHNALYGALKEAVKLEIVLRNLADVVRPELQVQNNNARAAQAWTAQEAAAFIAVARTDPLYPLFYLMLSLGMRRGEVVGLRWEHVNLEKRTLRIQEATAVVNGKPKTVTPKTANSERNLRLPLEVIDVLTSQKATQKQAHLEAGVKPTRDYVFTTGNGTAFHPDNVNRTLRRLATVAGVRVVRVHDLRHTYASLARRHGVPLEIVSEKLGHARPSFTADVYRHTFEDEHEAATINLSELLSSRPRASA